MEFGKLDDIENVHWKIPADDPSNAKRYGDPAKLNLYFGTPAWGSKFWRGKIYPQQLDAKEYLRYYAKNFNCIELNTTHYRIPSLEQSQDWLEQVPQHFKFCPKLHKDISHSRSGLFDGGLLKEWLRFLESMGQNLGPCFIQFHEQFSYQDKHALFSFLKHWPSEFKLALELRHKSWFQDHRILPALADYLHFRDIGLVITDVAGRRDVLHTTRSTHWTMIRLIGNDLHPSDESRLKDWAQRLSTWQEQGLQDSFLFLHQPDDVYTIEFSLMAQKVFQEAGFSDVPEIRLWEEEKNLLLL